MRAVAAITAVALLALPAGRATAQTATQDINITATVLAACTINNLATGVTPALATVIPISTAGAVVTAPIPAIGSPFTNVACNAPSNLQLTSLNGGVENATAPPRWLHQHYRLWRDGDLERRERHDQYGGTTDSRYRGTRHSGASRSGIRQLDGDDHASAERFAAGHRHLHRHAPGHADAAIILSRSQRGHP